MNSNMTEQLDQLFRMWDRGLCPGAQVLIRQHGKTLYEKCFGYGNLENKLKIHKESIFHVASISKEFTVMSILLLWKEGKLDLEDDIRKYLNEYIVAGGICILIVLLARWVAIFVPTKFMAFKYRFSPQTVKVLVWGGIRGGVSIALALSIPVNEYSQIIISITYCVVVFSIIVQGLTIAKVANPNKIATEEKIIEQTLEETH